MSRRMKELGRKGGLSTRGASKGTAKLTESQVLKIRTSAGTQREIGARYGVDHSTVGRIKRGEYWGHI